MFADDTKLILTIRPNLMLEDRVKLQDDIDKISEWCTYWQMCLNSEKCNLMSIGRSNLYSAYIITDHTGKGLNYQQTTRSSLLGGVLCK